jgi:two-component system, NarL family, invasion response regulator UvrY
MIRVFIADDHSLMREGLKLILSETEDVHVTGEAANGEEVLDKLKHNNFDVIVLDINMPRKTGFEVLEELRTIGNKIPVLILSTYSAEDYRDLATQKGASGYITKEQAPEKLIDAIRQIVK